MRRWGLVATGLAAVVVAGCSGAPKAPALPAGLDGIRAWQTARAEVAALSDELSADEPYSMNVTLELVQQQLGQRMRARGAVAVMPPHALRMILLGPGGTTALDLWVCGDAFRFAVPAIDLERRGDANTPRGELRGLPVDFLRWWFLRPLAGRLLSFFDQPSGARRYLLRDQDHVVDVLRSSSAHDSLSVRRTTVDDEEGVTVTRSRCGEVAYFQRSTGIDIDVRCEKLNATKPPARAFADPDEPERMCELISRDAS